MGISSEGGNKLTRPRQRGRPQGNLGPPTACLGNKSGVHRTEHLHCPGMKISLRDPCPDQVRSVVAVIVVSVGVWEPE